MGQHHGTRQLCFLLTAEIPDRASERIHWDGEDVVQGATVTLVIAPRAASRVKDERWPRLVEAEISRSTADATSAALLGALPVATPRSRKATISSGSRTAICVLMFSKTVTASQSGMPAQCDLSSSLVHPDRWPCPK